MNTTTEYPVEAAKRKRGAARKLKASRCDPFTEQLLQMDDEGKPIHDITDWLKTQGVTTADSNVSKFLASRRERREAKRQLDKEMNRVEALQEWRDENPNPIPAAVSERFKLLALDLSLQPKAPPEVLKLADRLAGTASRVEYRTRKLVMEEAKHAEWVKCEQTRALELCLDESKKHPAVADMYRAAFAALRECRRLEEGA